MQSLTQEELIRILQKRKWWIFISIAVCTFLFYGGWKVFPKTYKSTAIVTIDSPKVAKDYVKGLGGAEGKGFEDPATIAMQQVLLSLTNQSVLMPILVNIKPYPHRENETVETLMKRLRRDIIVARPRDGIGVGISYLHSDPYVAQAVVSFFILKLQEDNARRREGLIETTTEFLSAELSRMKGELEVKEQAISDFKKAHIGELPGQMEANLRTLDRLQADLTTSSDSLNKAGERLTALEKAIREIVDVGTSDVVQVEKNGRMGGNKPLDLRGAKLEELKQRLSELLGIYKENYPDVMHLREEIRQLESEAPRSVDSGQSNFVEKAGGQVEDHERAVRKPMDPFLRELIKDRDDVKSEMGFLKGKQANTVRQIKELELHVQRMPAAEQRLTILIRDYENLQKSYQSLLDKRANARIVENYESRQFGEQYRLIEPANLPYSEEPPILLHFLFGGVLLGCVIGLGGAIGVELVKPGFRRPEELESHLSLPVIASIPPLRCQSKNLHLITKWEPHSIIAEQYRVASTRLLMMTDEKKGGVTLVASSIMGEGKTTTAVNLAYVLAHDLKKSTLLIDCDFKRPMVHEYMDVLVKPGLSEALQGHDILEDCIHPFDDIPLSILPCGDPKARPTSISGIQYVKRILPELTARYDHVLLDGPPVLTLADVNILSSVADRVILVVRAGLTSQEMVRTAMKQLRSNSHVIGAVLTQVEIEFAPYLAYEKYYATKNN